MPNGRAGSGEKVMATCSGGVEEQVVQQKKRNDRKDRVVSMKTRGETKGTG